MGLLRWIPTIKYEPRKAKLKKALKNMDGPTLLTSKCYYCNNIQRSKVDKRALDKLHTDSKDKKKVKQYSGGYKQMEEWKLSGLWIKISCGSCGRSYISSFPDGDLSYSSKETEVNEGRYEPPQEDDSSSELLGADVSSVKDILELYNSGEIDDEDLMKLRDAGEIPEVWYDIIRGKVPDE